eukprot:533667-Prymnesium_polylepis.1
MMCHGAGITTIQLWPFCTYTDVRCDSARGPARGRDACAMRTSAFCRDTQVDDASPRTAKPRRRWVVCRAACRVRGWLEVLSVSASWSTWPLRERRPQRSSR